MTVTVFIDGNVAYIKYFESSYIGSWIAEV